VKPHRFHPEADEEYAAAASHYAEISPELGGRCYDEIEPLVAEVCSAPHRFCLIDADVRRHLAAISPMPCFTSMNRSRWGSSPSCRCGVAPITGSTC